MNKEEIKAYNMNKEEIKAYALMDEARADQLHYLIDSARKSMNAEKALLLVTYLNDDGGGINAMVFSNKEKSEGQVEVTEIIFTLTKNLQAVLDATSNLRLQLKDRDTGEIIDVPDSGVTGVMSV